MLFRSLIFHLIIFCIRRCNLYAIFDKLEHKLYISSFRHPRHFFLHFFVSFGIVIVLCVANHHTNTIQIHFIYKQYPKKDVLPKSIEICMKTPWWCPSGWAPTWRTKTSRNICYRVLLQKREFIPRGTHKRFRETFPNT